MSALTFIPFQRQLAIEEITNERRRHRDERVAKFLCGYNCAESVLLTMTTQAGITSPLVPKIATPFGGGIARSGSVCGCVAGALMYVGIKLGRTKTTDDREKAYEVATTFLEAFERKFGSLICYELIGCDFRTLEGKARWERINESKCGNFVKETVEILLRLEKPRCQKRLKKTQNEVDI